MLLSPTTGKAWLHANKGQIARWLAVSYSNYANKQPRRRGRGSEQSLVRQSLPRRPTCGDYAPECFHMVIPFIRLIERREGGGAVRTYVGRSSHEGEFALNVKLHSEGPFQATIQLVSPRPKPSITESTYPVGIFRRRQQSTSVKTTSTRTKERRVNSNTRTLPPQTQENKHIRSWSQCSRYVSPHLRIDPRL